MEYGTFLSKTKITLSIFVENLRVVLKTADSKVYHISGLLDFL